MNKEISKELRIVLMMVLQKGYVTPEQCDTICKELQVGQQLTQSQINKLIDKL